ncbi:PREDICTED: josephin-2 [Gekko japonicus]|uniref:ubiquitinyl hydrolase 1 n=1 Tax=Gekko japonicus TaxID=146911 RepID=A0ABM1KG99_GEKJA|nr:PREDICTED: josephin-2 [Gekko japonicus]XP_015272737.1 PREDICTED: josephin-2 [Gekko japonicus]
MMSGSSGRSEVSGLYHERQRLELCAVHALNNVLQERLFTQEAADEICKRLAPDARWNPHRSFLGTGNYDVNVIMAALQSVGLVAIWWDKRRPLEQLSLEGVLGFIVNVPSNVSLGFLSLPMRRRHWIAVRQLDGTYYNLDSKLKAPVPIGGEAELRLFLQEVLSQGPCELLLVVPHEAEEAGSWLSTVK